MPVDNAGQLHISPVGQNEPNGYFIKSVGVEFVRVVEPRGVDQIDYILAIPKRISRESGRTYRTKVSTSAVLTSLAKIRCLSQNWMLTRLDPMSDGNVRTSKSPNEGALSCSSHAHYRYEDMARFYIISVS